MGFDVGKIIRDLLFSELFNFIDKIIPEKSRLLFKMWKKYFEGSENSEKIWNMRNSNKVFGGHDKIIWSI